MGNVDYLTQVRLQQPQEQCYPVLQVHAGSFHVSIIHPNSDMVCRIFNMHMWSFLCVLIHTGVGNTDSESAQHFWIRKNLLRFSCAPDRTWTRVMHEIRTWVWHSTTWATPSLPYKFCDGRWPCLNWWRHCAEKIISLDDWHPYYLLAWDKIYQWRTVVFCSYLNKMYLDTFW